MTKILKSALLVLILSVSAININAANQSLKAGQALTPGAMATLQAKLSKARPGLEVKSAVGTALPGILELELTEGPVLYMSDDGSHFIAGQLFKVAPGGVVNLTEKKQDKGRIEALASLKDEDMIIYPPKGEIKAQITVFTDVDCGYCRKLHREIPALNEMGISLRYLAFPRAGIGSASYKKISSAFCAKDKLAAMNALKSGRPIEENLCEGNPVDSQYALGRKMGVTGTPSMVMDNGTMLPGYMPAASLAQTLGVKVQ